MQNSEKEKLEKLVKRNSFRKKTTNVRDSIESKNKENKEEEISISSKNPNLFNRNNNKISLTTKSKFPVIAQNQIINETPKIEKNFQVETSKQEINSEKDLENKKLIEELNKRLEEVERENYEVKQVILIYKAFLPLLKKVKECEKKNFDKIYKLSEMEEKLKVSKTALTI